MSLRVCTQPGCPKLVQSGRCTDCRRAHDRARGSRQERGYDAEHDQERAKWAPEVATGTVTCRRASNGTCRADSPTITATEPWDLGHPDNECPAPRAPEHLGCNRSTAPRRGLLPAR